MSALINIWSAAFVKGSLILQAQQEQKSVQTDISLQTGWISANSSVSLFDQQFSSKCSQESASCIPGALRQFGLVTSLIRPLTQMPGGDVLK